MHHTILLRDVVRTFSIENEDTVERLSKYLAINSGTMASYANISDSLSISFQTVKKYINALVKGGVVQEVRPFFTNKTREITKAPKVYFVDTGLRNAVAGWRGPELNGQLFENYVFSELLKMGLEIKYWRTKSKSEVDFVVENEGEIIPIAVKIQASTRKIERGMRSFIEKYHPEIALVVCHRCEEGEVELDGTTVRYAPVWKLQSIFKK